MSNSLPLSPHGVVMLSPHGVKGTGAQIGQVLALHPLAGTAPFMLSECGRGGYSYDYTTTPTTYSASDIELQTSGWADLIGAWLGNVGGEEPDHDANDVAGGYFLKSELLVTLSLDGATPFPVFDDIQIIGKHTGSPGAVVSRTLTAWDWTTGAMGYGTYTLSDGGVEVGDSTMPWAVNPSTGLISAADSVTKNTPISWAIPPGMGIGTNASGSAYVTANTAGYTASSVGTLHSTQTVYTLALTNPNAAGDVLGELSTLLDQINLFNPAQKYSFASDPPPHTPRVLVSGEFVEVTHIGPSPGVPLMVALNSVGNPLRSATWMALSMNADTFDYVNANGESGVPGSLRDGDSEDAYGHESDNWAMLKSMVQLPAGSYTKTVYAYQQQQKNLVGYAASHSPGTTPPTLYAGGELLSSPTYAVTGGRWYYFSPGAWISLTKAS